jgi:signal transduction histidine kinase
MVVLFAVLPKIGFAQRNPNHYSTEQGLSNNFVYCVFKDSRGVLWAGTESGLNCFNGVMWDKVDLDNGDLNSESSKKLFSTIAEDKKGNLYFGSAENGLYVYNFLLHTFDNYNIKNTKVLQSNYIYNIININDSVYLCTEKGLYLYNIKTKIITKSKYHESIKNSYITDIFVKNDITFISTLRDGVFVFKKDVEIYNTRKSKFKECIFFDIEMINNTIVFTSQSGIYRYNNCEIYKILINQDIQFSNSYFLGIVKTKNKVFLVNLYKGIYELNDFVNNAMQLMPIDQTIRKNGTTNTMVFDSISNSMIVGNNDGIEVHTFNCLPFKSSKKDNLNCGTIIEICNLEGEKFLLGTYNGLYYYNGHTGENQKIALPKGEAIVKTIKKFNGKILIGSTNGIFEYKNKIVYANTLLQPLKEFKNYSCGKSFVYNDSVLVISSEESKYFLVYYLNSKICEKVPYRFVHGVINCYMPINRDSFLVGVNSGVYLYCINSKKAYKLNVENYNSINITDIEKTDKGIFVSSNDIGTSYFTRKLENGYELQASNNSRLENSLFVFCNKSSLLSIGNKGIEKREFGKAIKHYLPSDGYIKNEFAELAKWRKDSLVYFGNGTDLIQFDFNANETKEKSKIIIQKIEVLEGSKTKIFNHLQPLNFKYNQNNITIHILSANSFSVDKNIVYYKLNNSDYVYNTGMDRNIKLVNLAMGEYTIQFYNDNKYCFTSTAMLHFVISPPWWKTLWFKILIFLIASSILFFGFTYYLKSELKKKQLQIEKLEAIENERKRMSADLHDDIGSHISTVQLLANKVSENTSNEYVAEFKTTVKELGQKIREIIWVTKSENDTLENFILYTRQYIAKQMDLADILLTIHIPDAIPDIVMPSAMRRDVYLCIKECINNIVKHADAGKVDVEIAIVANKVEITIQDDGVGLKDGNAFGNGLKQMNERLKKHGGGYEMVENVGCRSVMWFLV